MPLDLATFVSVLKGSTDIYKASKEILQETNDDLESKITQHIKTIEVWSGRIQTLGMLEPLATPDVTIPLLINSAPRTFIKSHSRTSLSENDIVDSMRNYLILGDPGSGKTTTIKRLIRRILIDAPASENDRVSFPILIIARELKVGQTLYREIADILGLAYQYQEHGPREVSNSAPYNGDRENTGNRGIRAGDYYYNGRRLKNIITEFLNQANVLLLVDGIDEVDPDFRASIESELGQISRGDMVKIVVTCRSGEFGRSQIEGFSVVEIAPLTDFEIKEIVNRWASNPRDFLRELDAAPYRDSADRPLFLTQLILVHNALERLPQRPAEVYHRIVSLCLEIWDRERRISRRSHYAEFASERKLEFIAALAFVLTYEAKAKRFTSEQLITAYERIHNQFRLPLNEAQDVCKEIESHTGLIYEAYGAFEFSHLSLQEYLCAYHMVRLPFDPTMVEYLISYPAPIAVAVSLSADPSGWLAALIYHTKNFAETDSAFRGGRTLQEEVIIALFSRIVVEAPMFRPTYLLGLAILRLLGSIRSLDLYGTNEGEAFPDRLEPESANALEIIRRFLALEGMLASISEAFLRYFFEPIENLSPNGKGFIMHLGLGGFEKYSGRLPEEIRIKKTIVRFFQYEYNMVFNSCSAEDEVVEGPLPFDHDLVP